MVKRRSLAITLFVTVILCIFPALGIPSEKTMANTSSFEYRPVTALAWSSNNGLLAIAANEMPEAEDAPFYPKLTVVERASGNTVLQLPFEQHWSVIESLYWRESDQEIVAVSTSGQLTRVYAQTGMKEDLWDLIELVSSASFHPHERVVALALNARNGIFVDIRHELTGTQLQRVQFASPSIIDWIGWSPDGSRLAFLNRAGEGHIYIWDGAAANLERVIPFLPPNSSAIPSGAWSADGTMLAIATLQYRDPDGQYPARDAIIFSVQTGTALHSMQGASNVYPIAWSRTRNQIAGVVRNYGRPTDEISIVVWNGDNGEQVEIRKQNAADADIIDWASNGDIVVGYTLTYDQWITNPSTTQIVFLPPKSE